MRDLDQARELARNMAAIATECGVNTRAFLTDMDTPLGRAAGLWLEVKEAVDCLECRGPEDLQELVLHFAASLLVQTGKSPDMDAALNRAAVVLASGKPREKWDQMLAAQGAKLDEFNQMLKRDHAAPVVLEWETRDEGFITRCDARIIGEVVRDLGAGRFRKEDGVDHAVGIDRLAKPGEPFGVGQTLARVHAQTREQAEAALARLKTAVEFDRDRPPDPAPLIREVVA